MGQIVCTVCGETIDFFENEKISVLYGKCSNCKHEQQKNHK